MSIRTAYFAGQSDPATNRHFRRRWTPAPWEALQLEAHAHRAERQGDNDLARDLAMRALRIRVAEVRR